MPHGRAVVRLARRRARASRLRRPRDRRRRCSFAVPQGRVTAIVGANACGKSTLLRALARLLKPQSGAVLLDGQQIHTLQVQGGRPPARPAAAVADRAGRDPRRRPRRPWPLTAPVAAATVDRCRRARRRRGPRCDRRPTDLADRHVDELSGGQRQRVWIAMALAQETPLLLLDEPTTFLDIAHQIEVLELVAELNLDAGAHDRDGAPRPEPGLSLRRPHRRHEARRDRRRGSRPPR